MTLARESAFASDALDPTYGRVEGDVTVVVAAGATFAARTPRVEGELRLRYLESTGLFATYEDAFGAGSEPARVLAGGLEIRPVFLYRWLEGLETERARFDLTLDSIGLELGTTLSQPASGGALSTPGVEVGVGIEVPLAETAVGPWVGIHGGVRWGADALALGRVVDEVDRAAFLSITLAWHQSVLTHTVDVGDRAPQ